MRFSAQRMSSMQCEGWIEAMTPSSLKRATSSARTTWECSMRWRASRPPFAARALAKASRIQALALSPMAWAAICSPAASAFLTSASSSAWVWMGSPDVVGIVGVGLEEERRAGAHGAVDEELDRAQAQEGIAVGGGDADALEVGPAVGAAPGVDAHAQLAFAQQVLVDLQVLARELLSWTLVTPSSWAWRMAARMARSRLSRDSGGMTLSTRSMAVVAQDAGGLARSSCP